MVELIWEGKYDKDGKRVAPLRIELPFQTVETVNESAQQRQKTLFSLMNNSQDHEWRNRLIWGDKKYVLPSLLPEFAGKVDLIYIDPPFATGADFSFQAKVGEERFEKEANVLEQKAYRDTWGRGLEGFMQWFYDTASLLHELLADDGSLYVHLDWHVGHYAKAVLDEIFGYANFRNEIIVKRVKKNIRERERVRTLNVATDMIYFYAKSESTLMLPPTKPDFREDRWHGFDAPGLRTGMDYDLFGHKPPSGRHWMRSLEIAEEWIEEGRLRPNPRSGKPEYLIDASDESLVDSLWDDIQAYTFKYNYPTEKNEALLERIIQASSNESDLVLDCFCGSGTTAAVAEKLGRRWITCDLGRFAIHTARKRLLAIEDVKPFVVQNLGKYERQAWQQAEFGERHEEITIRYRKFILELYNAEPITGTVWLHGFKDRRFVHVGTVDSPVSEGDVRQIAIEYRKLIGDQAIQGIDILGWDFALDMNETTKQIAQEAAINLRFLVMPREILEKKAVEQGDIHFHELAALFVDVKTKGREVTVNLTDFLVPLSDVPAEVVEAVKNWSDWVDYWAVDFNFRDDTFHNEWQSYRTRSNRSLELSATHRYSESGEYLVMVKVIDILGNDTTKVVRVQVM